MAEPVFFSRFEGRVDRAAGIIYGVRLITPGDLTKSGHDLEVDATTIDQLHTLAQEMPNGIKTKLNHRSGIEATNGRMLSFRKEGGAWYGDWHLLKSHGDFELILDLAETQPNNIGISLSADGAHLSRGKGKTRLARFTEIFSADLVDRPAANPGLFERGVDKSKKGMTEEQFSELKALVTKQGETITALSTACKSATDEVGSMKTFFETIKKELAIDDQPDKSELSEIRTAMTELATQFTAIKEAVTNHGQKPAPAGSERTDLNTKTAEEVALQATLTKAKTDLEAAKGLSKYALAGRIEKEHGKDWKKKLTDLEAKK